MDGGAWEGMMVEGKPINGVSDEKDENQTTHILTHYCFFVF